MAGRRNGKTLEIVKGLLVDSRHSLKPSLYLTKNQEMAEGVFNNMANGFKENKELVEKELDKLVINKSVRSIKIGLMEVQFKCFDEIKMMGLKYDKIYEEE